MSPHENKDIRAEDLLAAYEMGLLEGDERARFEAATLENPDLLDELYEMAPHVEAILRHPDLANAAARSAAAPKRLSWFERVFSPRVLTPVAVAAALALLIFNLGERPDDLRTLVAVEPLAYTQVDVRAGESDRDTVFHQAMTEYAAEDYRGAIEGLTTAIEEFGDDASWIRLDQGRLYLGISYLMIDEPAAAAPVLEIAAASPILPIADSSRWYLAQSRLLLNDVAAAREILEALSADSPVYGLSATDLLARIDHMNSP